MQLITALSIITLSSIIGISLLGLPQSFAQVDENNTTPTINGLEWKTYSNDKIGISFEYPSDWTIKEKTNRFDTGPEVLIYNGYYNMIKVITTPESAREDIKREGFQTSAKIVKNMATTGDTVIEDIDFNKYRIDGKETGSYLALNKDANGEEIPTQTFIINSGPLPMNLMYQDSKDQF